MKEKQMLMEAAVDSGNIAKLNKIIWDQKPLQIENMVLGNARALMDPQIYETYGISAVLTCAEELANATVPVDLAARCVLPCKDNITFRLPFKKAIVFLAEQTAAGRTVLVHCWAGHNRAGAIIAAYFMQKWGKSAVYMARYLSRRRFGCLWNLSFCRQLIKWEARLNTISLKNYAIEAVKIGTYYSEDKEEVNAYVLSCFDEVRKSTDPDCRPNFEENALTQKYSVCELLDAAHGEECNIFDPFDEAEDSDGTDDELSGNPKKKARIEVNKTNGSHETAAQKLVKKADPVAKTKLQEQFEAFEDGVAIAPETLPTLMEACVNNQDIPAAVTLFGKVSWESIPSEVLDECFTSIKALYNPESQADIPRSLRRRLNQAVNELARLRHARTPEGMDTLECTRAIERLNAVLDGAPETLTHKGVCSWIQEKLKVNGHVAALCLRKLIDNNAVRKVKRRYVFPSPLKATSATWSTEDVALAEKLVSKVREKRNARSKKGRKSRRTN
eukprot:GEMP01019214.1.p1 GENE.GEMP01019214.1~~GEMP01019214.1.p1  ORF type:complete len:502 (+),score=112.17 GEMP01019214.1:838-2343(+)